MWITTLCMTCACFLDYTFVSASSELFDPISDLIHLDYDYGLLSLVLLLFLLLKYIFTSILL